MTDDKSSTEGTKAGIEYVMHIFDERAVAEARLDRFLIGGNGAGTALTLALMTRFVGAATGGLYPWPLFPIFAVFSRWVDLFREVPSHRSAGLARRFQIASSGRAASCQARLKFDDRRVGTKAIRCAPT